MNRRKQAEFGWPNCINISRWTYKQQALVYLKVRGRQKRLSTPIWNKLTSNSSTLLTKSSCLLLMPPSFSIIFLRPFVAGDNGALATIRPVSLPCDWKYSYLIPHRILSVGHLPKFISSLVHKNDEIKRVQLKAWPARDKCYKNIEYKNWLKQNIHCVSKNCTPKAGQHEICYFPNTKKNPKYTFCRKFHSEWKLWVLLWWPHYDVIHRQ